MFDSFAMFDLAGLCASAGSWLETAGRNGGVPIALLAAGLAAGFSHCTGMCGPFVLTQVVAGLPPHGAAPIGVLRRLRGASLLPYHFGRLTTYGFLGAVSGGFAGVAADLVGVRWLLAAILIIATAYCVIALGRSLGWIAPVAAWPIPGLNKALNIIRWPRIVGRASRLGGYPLGLALGFLPCGLIYAALAAAAGTGSATSGAIAMAAFALGTVPGLLAVGVAGGFVARRFRKLPQLAAAPLLVVNIAILSALAFRAFA